MKTCDCAIPRKRTRGDGFPRQRCESASSHIPPLGGDGVFPKTFKDARLLIAVERDTNTTVRALDVFSRERVHKKAKLPIKAIFIKCALCKWNRVETARKRQRRLPQWHRFAKALAAEGRQVVDTDSGIAVTMRWTKKGRAGKKLKESKATAERAS